MKSVTVDKAELLEVLKKNRERHEQNYREAVRDYRTLAKFELAEMVEKIKKQTDSSIAKIEEAINAQEPARRTNYRIVDRYVLTTKAPVSHLKSYGLAIRMAEMSVSNNIELTEQRFNELVLDEWDWKADFDEEIFANKAKLSSYTV